MNNIQKILTQPDYFTNELYFEVPYEQLDTVSFLLEELCGYENTPFTIGSQGNIIHIILDEDISIRKLLDFIKSEIE